MTADSHESPGATRYSIYALLIVISLASMVGRILTVRSSLGETPLLSANDRSRWATVRSLVDEQTYQIDHVIFKPDGRRDREWYTIDLVRHRGRDGREHYYSSKPPLLATLLAGPYWLIRQLTGVRLADEPFYVVRLLLILFNVVPLALYFVLLAQLVERFGGSDWGRLFVFATATFGTFLTTFSVTLNNHLPAAISVLLATYAAVQIAGGRRPAAWFAVAGLSAAFAATNELPALSFFALLTAVLASLDLRRTATVYLPASLLVAVAFFGTNYWAHDSWRMPYAHRQDGQALARVDGDVSIPAEGGPVSDEWQRRLSAAGIAFSPQVEWQASAWPNRFSLFDPADHRRVAVQRQKEAWEFREWDNWYEYENSYWLPGRKTGVDKGEPSRAVYAFHMLIGHRGIFSLTPVWILSLLGAVFWLVHGPRNPRALAAAVVLLSVVCLTFYLLRPLQDRNYGGVASGFRWMFWFTPLWLLCALPAADAAGRRRTTRWLAVACLLVSVLSASYASLNPWSHSWIYHYWTHLGWLSAP